MAEDESNKPKYQRIRDDLLEKITSGLYSPGQRLPSETELVDQFGASRITVARALRELQTQGLIERRAGSGTYVRRNASTSSQNFGLLIPDLGQTEIFEPICQGMAQTRQSAQYGLLWGRTFAGPDREKQAMELCQHYIAKRVAGVFFAPLELTKGKDEMNRRIVEAFERAGVHIVLLDRDIAPYPLRSCYDRVGIDNRRAGYAITEHLLKLGCRRIVFVGRPYSAATVDARVAGYREALYAYGAEFAPGFVQRIEPSDEAAVPAVVDQVRPEAFVCANDFTAGHLMHTLLSLSVRVPQDARIVGIDDVKYASLLPVPLTTVHQPCQEMGGVAMAAMVERLGNPEMPPREISLDFHLVIRESCGVNLPRPHCSGGDHC